MTQGESCPQYRYCVGKRLQTAGHLFWPRLVAANPGALVFQAGDRIGRSALPGRHLPCEERGSVRGMGCNIYLCRIHAWRILFIETS